MATVFPFLMSEKKFYDYLQRKYINVLSTSRRRFLAAKTIQRYVRGLLIRRHIAMLNKQAIIIQSVWRGHTARQLAKRRLNEKAKEYMKQYYDLHATRIQALWRGILSRRDIFCYAEYRKWLARVEQENCLRLSEGDEYALRSSNDARRAADEEARTTLAFIVFKLHHMLRTVVSCGMYSDITTHELSNFEKLLSSVRYTEYSKAVRSRYNKYVKKFRPKFKNKEKLFPCIGYGEEYWYLSLPELYEISHDTLQEEHSRFKPTHFDPNLHKKPFIWRALEDPKDIPSIFTHDIRGPHAPERCPCTYCKDMCPCKGAVFHLYKKHYVPNPDLLNYIDFHVNLLIRRKCSIINVT